MSLQESTFTTTHVLDNEIIKANDFEYAFEQLIKNVSRATQMFLESEQDFVINGKVLPFQGMNVQVSPIYGVCKSSGLPFGRTEQTDESIGFEESSAGRIDIIEVQGDWETYDNQQRAFNDPDTDTQTYQYVDTKRLMKPVYRVKKGEEGVSVAPEVDTGWVKLAEVVIRANNSTITASDIKNITADIAGEENTAWTTEKDITYNIGYISDVNERFRVQHNADGTHKDDCINTDSLNIGIGTKQVNGNVLPVGGAVSIPTQTIASTDSILSVLTKTAAMLTSLYNAYLKFGNYKFNGELAISAIADANNALTNPLKLVAAGDGTAELKIGTNTVLSIDANGKLSTNGYTASSNNNLITKAVTDAISTALSNLTIRVDNIESTSDNTIYANNTLSSGTGGRYNVDSSVIYAATTENVTLSGSQTIDGTSPADGSYILVKNQITASENGIYQYSSSSLWTRVNDYLSPNALKAKIFNVVNGTVNGGKMFYLAKVNFVNGESFGSDDITFSEYFGSVKELPNKVAVRDTSGRLKTAEPSGNSDAVNKLYLSQCANMGGICTDLINEPDKTVNILNFKLQTGSIIRVMFQNGNNAVAPTLNVSGTGAKDIKVIKAGSKVTPINHTGYWRGDSNTSSEMWQPYTTLDLMYDGTDWVICGNPVVEDYSSNDGGYTVYANGLIMQWMKLTDTTTTNNKEFDLCVGYTSFYIPSLSLNVTTNDTDNLEWRHMGVQTSNLNKIIITRMSTTPRFVFCIGY